ncbi:unnamed protein product [Dibothriocephalus latus]|uniref:ENTH domain-containing protein n=1 Tax=Dibothriocephalus latus TaxID=60516 RepID=A0A3P7NP83_DIBLA|nr:unnamed protein product [Dibothriocephalus latus]
MPIRRKIKNVVANYSAAELLVREATSNDPSLPDEYTLLKIADATKISYYYEETTRMIFKRLNDKSKNWRHIYKALLVIEVCLKNGSVAFVKECQHQAHQITTLTDFMFLGEDGTEASRLVREQAKRVSRLLADNELLHEERKVARSQRNQIRQDYAYSRPRSLSTCSFDQQLPGKDSNVHRSLSYARNDAEEEEQIKMAIRLSVAELDEKTRNALKQQTRSENHNTTSDVDTLLDLSDSPPMTERERRGFDDWLASRKWKTNQPSQGETKGMPPVPALTLKQRAEQQQLQQHLMQQQRAEKQQQQQQQNGTSTGDLDFLDFVELSFKPNFQYA